MLGGNEASTEIDDILVWDATNEEWKEMGKMKQSSAYPAVAVVEVDEIVEYCT